MRYPSWSLLLLVCGCGSEVLVSPQASAIDEPCEPTIIEPAAEAVTLRVEGPGTFVGEHLHVDATVAGTRAYTILDLAEDGHAYVLAQHPALNGSTALTLITGELAVRVAPDAVALEIVDLAEPLAPVVVARHELPGLVPAQRRDVGFGHGHAFVCVGEDEPVLTSVDLTDPLAPVAGSTFTAFACRLDDRGDASGDTWLSWRAGEGVEVSSVDTYALAAEGPTKLVSFGFNPSGVSSYGRAKGGVTDGDSVLMDTESEHWLLLFGEAASPAGPYHSVGLGGARKLLAMHAGTAYFALATGVRAIDVAAAGGPAQLPLAADLTLDLGATEAIAVDGQRLALSHDGALVVVPRDHQGAISPTEVFVTSGEPTVVPCP